MVIVACEVLYTDLRRYPNDSRPYNEYNKPMYFTQSTSLLLRCRVLCRVQSLSSGPAVLRWVFKSRVLDVMRFQGLGS